MRGRVAKALEELAKAVRECADDEWEVVEAEKGEIGEKGSGSAEVVCVPKEPEEPPCAAGSKTGREAVASDICYHKDWRIYVVLANPNDQNSVGCWEGPNPQTWKAIEKTLRGGSLAGSGARLRRVEDFKQAVKLWKEVFPTRPMPVKNMA